MKTSQWTLIISQGDLLALYVIPGYNEAGIKVGRVSYLASQPWPFPASLMFGCRGEALSEDITIDPQEIEDALWMSREEILSAFAGSQPAVLDRLPDPLLVPVSVGRIDHVITIRKCLAIAVVGDLG